MASAIETSDGLPLQSRERDADRAITAGRQRRSREPGSSQRSTGAGELDASTEGRLNRISRRAYELYQARGGEHGRDLEDWLQAEREIDGVQ
jgi:hypothetical protein